MAVGAVLIFGSALIHYLWKRHKKQLELPPPKNGEPDVLLMTKIGMNPSSL